MNVRLKNLLTEVESRLDAAAQDRLGDLVEAFVATWGRAGTFTPDERAHLEKIAAEPFDPAPAEDVAALFARRA